MRIGVVGTGTLGPSIAQVFSICDKVETVYLCKGRPTSKSDGLKSVENSFYQLVVKGKLTQEQANTYLSKIIKSDVDNLKDVDLIIEAVKEDLEVKRNLFKKLDVLCETKTIFASNTSSLPINLIGEGLSRPLLGMHFFNPAPVMKLVEIIVNSNIPQEQIDFVMDISKEIEKKPVLVREAPGFIVNRILIPMINEAIGIYAEGVANVEDIDTAMKLGANHPMGPLALGDLIGLDVVLAIMEEMLKETGDVKYRPEALLKKMVRENKLGRKTKEGFYKYQ